MGPGAAWDKTNVAWVCIMTRKVHKISHCLCVSELFKHAVEVITKGQNAVNRGGEVPKLWLRLRILWYLQGLFTFVSQ